MQLGEASRWHATQAAAWPDLVEVLTPDGHSRPIPIRVLVSAFVQMPVIELAPEALDVAVLNRSLGLNQDTADAMSMLPGLELPLVNSGPLSARTACGYPRNNAARSGTRVACWRDMPKSTINSPLSWLGSSATVGCFSRLVPDRLSLTKSTLHISLNVLASCSGTRSWIGRFSSHAGARPGWLAGTDGNTLVIHAWKLRTQQIVDAWAAKVPAQIRSCGYATAPGQACQPRPV